MNVILRGVRVIDPLSGVDQEGLDVWLCDGRIAAIDRRISAPGVGVIDMTPPPGRSAAVLSPGFIDLHTHLREPGEDDKETIESGANAAAAGGFTQVLAMANTNPPVDSPAAVGEARVRGNFKRVRVHTVAAATVGLRGEQLVDIYGCASAGAVAFSDDGRNALPSPLLADALRAAHTVGRAVLVHPEDEGMVAAANPGVSSVVRCPERPAACEASAVRSALAALEMAAAGRLHLQHLSAAVSIDLLRAAREAGVPVTAEVTPHHLSMWMPFEVEPEPMALRKVNPPLRSEHDREVVVRALREGLIDAVATDHAPHTVADKSGNYVDAPPGMIGLETALAACITLGAMGGGWLPVLVERLTAGPYRVAGAEVGLREPRLRAGEVADCVLFDPEAEWTVGAEPLHSRSLNTPLWGVPLRGRVLLTLVDGHVAHLDHSTMPSGHNLEAVRA
ncbi:MAG TPA: dihydroorotase [Candidatus Dormibacteraeota bacterium]|jgi:dihydroorotase|nr:dihydroorotase [Candidatus Dormibacteraeota bacterium]